MEITYDWIFNPLTVKPAEGSLTDVVVLVDWRRTATDGQYSADVYGQVSLGPPNPLDFTAFSDLTKVQVQGWVEAAMGSVAIANIDESLDGNIERQRNPPVVSMSPPWGQSA